MAWSSSSSLCPLVWMSSSALPCIILKKSSLPKSTLSQLHPNNWAFVRGFSILCTHFGLLPSVKVFLYFFKAKRLGCQLWVSFNGMVGKALFSLFQQSYKSFKGKFLKVRCNKRDPTLLYGFTLYWTQKLTFQGARCLESMSQRDQEVCHFFSNLKVVFDTTTLISQVFS